MKKILSILTILFTFSFTSHSYSKTEIHWWYGNSGFLGDVIIEIANRFNASQDQYTVIPTGKGSYEDNMAATIAAFRAPNNIQAGMASNDCEITSGGVTSIPTVKQPMIT